MDKKTVGLLGAVAGFAAVGAAQATPSPTTGPTESDTFQPSSYADLLTPVDNAVSVMQADDIARSRLPKGGVQLADIYIGVSPPPHHHHHHHHHHNN